MTPSPQPRTILRFRRAERHVHWALAIPFMVCWTTALVLVVVYNPDPQRPYREIFSWIHRLSGIALIVLPVIAVARTAGDIRVHFHNILQAWTWTLSDLRWLALAGLAAIHPGVKLPEQGKFNAAEKLNFMTLLGTYPLYIVTGLVMWLTSAAFLSWIVHFAMAVLATPLILGHIYMAAVNPSSRVGLSGMITGYVDRRWAKHHYGKWYRENFEKSERPVPPSERRRGAVVYAFLTGAIDRSRACAELGAEPADLDRWVVRFVSTRAPALAAAIAQRASLPAVRPQRATNRAKDRADVEIPERGPTG